MHWLLWVLVSALVAAACVAWSWRARWIRDRKGVKRQAAFAAVAWTHAAVHEDRDRFYDWCYDNRSGFWPWCSHASDSTHLANCSKSSGRNIGASSAQIATDAVLYPDEKCVEHVLNRTDK